MAAAAGLSVTLVPVLMVLFVRGRIRPESANPLNRVLVRLYRPVIQRVLRHPWWTLGLAGLLLLLSLWPMTRLGSEFIPPLDEGDVLYMPTTLPGVSPGKAAEILQQTDRILKTFPEVETVFGKVGRADTATDPAPLTMIETTIRLKPRDQWRPGLTQAGLIEAFDAALQIPGMGNVWVQPIRNRIDMLATGIKSPVGLRISGPDLAVINRIGGEIEGVLKPIEGTVSAFAERVDGGRYIELHPYREQLARYGLSIAQFNRIVAVAVGGQNIGQTVEGLARYPINLRYPRQWRDSVAALESLPVLTADGQTLTLGGIAEVAIVDGPPMIKSENARPTGTVFVDIRGRDLGSYVAEAKRAVAAQVALPAGYSITWAGQFEYLERAAQRLRLVIPVTLAIIFVLLYLSFGRWPEALLIMGTLPFALIGGVWLIWALGHAVSVASAIGFIALAGVSAEFGVIMLIYLDQALRRYRESGETLSDDGLDAAIIEGAVQRVRPKAMTVAVIVAGLLPMFWGAGTGSEIMQRIAAPMIGGMISAPLLSMLVLPAAYKLIHGRR